MNNTLISMSKWAFSFSVFLMCPFCIANENEKKPIFQIVIIGKGDKVPKDILRLTISPNGQLRDIMGHPVKKNEVAQVLKSAGSDSDPTLCLLFLHVADEKKTEIIALAEVLRGFKINSDPKKNTTIYVFLKNMAIPKKSSR